MSTKQKTSGRTRVRLSYANVIASLALFVALGGTAAAAATLARDSVGSPQIRADAVRPPEIESGAVRSSEIRDEDIKVADVATGARFALLPDVRMVVQDDGFHPPVPTCTDLKVCTNILTLNLASGPLSRTAEPPPSDPDRNWLIQAKAELLTQGDTTNAINICGLVTVGATGPKAVLDEVDAPDLEDGGGDTDGVALSAVVKKREGNPTIALRCTAHDGTPATDDVRDVVRANEVKITALEIGAVTGP